MKDLTYDELVQRWPGVDEYKIIQLVQDGLLSPYIICVDEPDETGETRYAQEIGFAQIDDSNIRDYIRTVRESFYDYNSILKTENNDIEIARIRISQLEIMLSSSGDENIFNIDERNKKKFLSLIRLLLSELDIDFSTTDEEIAKRNKRATRKKIKDLDWPPNCEWSKYAISDLVDALFDHEITPLRRSGTTHS